MATAKPCAKIRDEEIRRIGTNRQYVALTPKGLATQQLPPSWAAAIILCPGDNIDDVARWAAGLSAPDRLRIQFYAIGKLNVANVMERWAELGLGKHFVLPVTSFREFHPDFGLFTSLWTYEDVMTGRIT